MGLADRIIAKMKSRKRTAGEVFTATGTFLWLLDQLGRWQTAMSLKELAAWPWLTPTLVVIAGIALLLWSDYSKSKPLLYAADGQLIESKFVIQLGKHALGSTLVGFLAALAAFAVLIAVQHYGVKSQQPDTAAAFALVPNSGVISPKRGRSPIMVRLP